MEVTGTIVSKEQFVDVLRLFDPGSDILKLDEKNIARVYEYVRKFRTFNLNFGADKFRLISLTEFVAKLRVEEFLKFMTNLSIKRDSMTDIHNEGLISYYKTMVLDAIDSGITIEDVYRAAVETQKGIELTNMHVVAFDAASNKLLIN